MCSSGSSCSARLIQFLRIETVIEKVRAGARRRVSSCFLIRRRLDIDQCIRESTDLCCSHWWEQTKKVQNTRRVPDRLAWPWSALSLPELTESNLSVVATATVGSQIACCMTCTWHHWGVTSRPVCRSNATLSGGDDGRGWRLDIVGFVVLQVSKMESIGIST
jgi:hypothetical protein